MTEFGDIFASDLTTLVYVIGSAASLSFYIVLGAWRLGIFARPAADPAVLATRPTR